MTAGRDRLPWRTLFPSVLLPNALYATGQGAIIPVISIYALTIDHSYATAALVAAMLTTGQVVGTLPAGWLVGRVGERRPMLVASAVAGTGGVVCTATGSILGLATGVLLVGLAAAVFNTARHAYVTIVIPPQQRGRALAVVAGFNRLGSLIGPFITAGVVATTGEVRYAFLTVVVSSVLLVLTLVLMPVDEMPAARPADSDERPLGVLRTLAARRDVLLRLGVCAAIVNLTRTSRQIIIPLWAVALGVDDVDIALIVGVCSTLDVALVYLGGQIMDRHGRLWAGVPSLLAFAIAHIVLATTTSLGASFEIFVAMALLMSFGNGITSGIVATMGSDLADRRNPAAFLSSWRLITDSGPALAPYLISAVTGVASLAAASLTMGGLAVIGAAGLLRFVPRYLPARVPAVEADAPS